MATPLTDKEKADIQQVMSTLLAGGAELGVSIFTMLALVNRVMVNKLAIIDIALESERVGAALEQAILKHGPNYSDQLLARLESAVKKAREAKIRKVR